VFAGSAFALSLHGSLKSLNPMFAGANMPKILHVRITKESVDRLPRDHMIRDTSLAGFGVRRQQGRATYFLQKRIGRRVRWVTIGPHGSPWTAESARKEAYRLLGQIAGGETPVTRRRELEGKLTVREAAEHFMAAHGTHLKEASRVKYRYLIDRCINDLLGDRLIESIARADVMRLHTKMAKKPPLANYAVSVLSKIMSWAEDEGLRPLQSNPCFRLKKYRENNRQRYLSQEEYKRLGPVLDRTAQIDTENLYIVAAIRLLALTGARVGEILSLQWTFVDLERRMLLLPDSKTGQKVIRLNPQAVEFLRKIPKTEGNPYVIVGRRRGHHLVNLQKPWRRIRKEAKLNDVRLHDLRHSYASVGAAQKGSLPMIGRLLGHNHTRTTARYAHLAADPVDQLNASIGDTISKALSMAPKAAPATKGSFRRLRRMRSLQLVRRNSPKQPKRAPARTLSASSSGQTDGL
jgi:integrase